MAHWEQGDVVVDHITLVDGNGAPVTGASWTTIDTIDPDGSDFSLAISEVGNGVYKVQFTAAKTGHYFWVIATSGLSPNQTYEADFSVVEPAAGVSGVVTTQAAAGVSLNELIRMLATRVGDFLRITATSNGSIGGTSFTDALRLSAIPSHGMVGAALIFVAPSVSGNYLAESRVIDFSEDTTTLTLKPALPVQVVSGDQAWLTNLYSKGFYRDQYIDAINTAIQDAYPNHLVPLAYEHGIPWDPAVPWITLPTSVKKLYGVVTYESGNEANAVAIPRSLQNLGTLPGWWFDYANKRLTINEPFRGSHAGRVVKVLGYGRPAPLVNATDVTPIDAEWLVDMAAETLKLGTGDQRMLAAASMLRNIADSNRAKMAFIAEPDTLDTGN